MLNFGDVMETVNRCFQRDLTVSYFSYNNLSSFCLVWHTDLRLFTVHVVTKWSVT